MLYLIGYAQVLDSVSTNIALRNPPKSLSILEHRERTGKSTRGEMTLTAGCTYSGCADNVAQVDVHPSVAVHQVPIVRLSVLQLHQLHNDQLIILRRLGGGAKSIGAYHGVADRGLKQ